MVTGTGPLSRRGHELARAITALREQEPVLLRAADEIAVRLADGGTLLAAGNGGAAALADHLVAELVGRLSADRPRAPLAAVSLTASAALLTALANDFGFEAVFSRQVAALAGPRDVLVVMSTSGRSQNLVVADRTASQLGLYRLALLGRDVSLLAGCDAVLHIDADDPGTVQECHLLLIHALAEAVENAVVCVASVTDVAEASP